MARARCPSDSFHLPRPALNPSSPPAKQTLHWLLGKSFSRAARRWPGFLPREDVHPQSANCIDCHPFPPEACQWNRRTDPLSPVPAPSLPHSLLQPPSPSQSRGLFFSPPFPAVGFRNRQSTARPSHAADGIPWSIRQRLSRRWHFLVPPQLCNPGLSSRLGFGSRPGSGTRSSGLASSACSTKCLRLRSVPWAN